jgi:iron complex outermembrane receptor protein
MTMAIKAVLLASVLVCCWRVATGQAQEGGRDLAEFSLEELLQLEVTSVSKREQKLSEAAAAVFVITPEDIRRSGASSIPEALRLAPGLHVAQINANTWAISARGFNSEYANKLLVLIDGRSVYTPLFAGVYWDVQDVVLEDLDRIEVIRGPGGTLWGANAVNGVINIITKRAKETQGMLLAAGGGTLERGFGSVRYGSTVGDNLAYRAYAKYFNRGDFTTATGQDAADAWQMVRGGFRLDWDLAAHQALMVQGQVYHGVAGETITLPSLLPPFAATANEDREVGGGSFLTRWIHAVSPRSDLGLQFYYDRTERQNNVFDETRDTIDVDFQHRFRFGQRHDLTWGLGYRLTADHAQGSFFASVDPVSRTDNLVSAFIQDEITVIGERLRLILGTKLEHNDYTGFEVQPSGRLLWTPHSQHTVWAAISRAIRTPSRADSDALTNFAVFPGQAGIPNVLSVFGNQDLSVEKLLAYELGYRAELPYRVFLDIATFYNVYDDLLTFESLTPFFALSPPPPHIVIPQRTVNGTNAETYGVEVAVRWTPMTVWQMTAAYTWLNMKARRDFNLAGNDPNNRLHVHSAVNLPWNLEFDVALYFVDRLPNFDTPSYLRLDLRLGWKPIKQLDLSFVMQNLLDDRHPEFGSVGYLRSTEVPRSLYGKLTWRF